MKWIKYPHKGARVLIDGNKARAVAETIFAIGNLDSQDDSAEQRQVGRASAQQASFLFPAAKEPCELRRGARNAGKATQKVLTW